MKSTTPGPPSRQLFFDTVNAYQRTAAIKGAIELDFFTAMADRNWAKAVVGESVRSPDGGYSLSHAPSHA
jgi:hypothetical protein